MSDQTQLSPQIITGIPTGVKAHGHRVDFRVKEFDVAVDTKGYRMYWSRAAVCPCRNNPVTDQPDVACPLCHGLGRFYFLPEVGLENYQTDAYGNKLEFSPDRSGLLIMGIITQATQDPQVYEKFGEWVFGTIRVSVQAPNKLAYRDRLILLDSLMS